MNELNIQEKYIFKKTEKIVAALYLVSNLLKDKEPIKWKLRERSMSLISSVLVLNDELSFDKDLAIKDIFFDLSEILSTISLAKLGGLLSEMNFNILSVELEKILRFLKDNFLVEKEKKGYILSEKFFNDEINISPKKESNIKDKILEIPKKNTRKNAIIDLLKTKSNLTVKDVAQVVTDCSEKTIQRELIELVSQGVVKRDGERRWTRYSLR